MEPDYSEVEAKLRRLADRVHRGWAKLYPMTEQEREMVRQAAREQWEREEQVRQELAEAQRVIERAGGVPPKEQDKRAHDRKPDNDQTHTH